MEQLATSFSISSSGKLSEDVTNYNKNFCLGPRVMPEIIFNLLLKKYRVQNIICSVEST